jgi:hypothetical protein
MFSIAMSVASTQAKEGQNCQDHDDKADEINQSVHEFAPCTSPISSIDNQSQKAKFH